MCLFRNSFLLKPNFGLNPVAVMGFSTLSFCTGCLYRLHCKQLNNINFIASHSDFSSCKRSPQTQVWKIRPVTACVSDKKKPRSSQKYLKAGFKALEKEALVSSATKNFRNLKKWKWEWPPWEKFPKRYKLIAATALAFVICNMDKVNLSVAIIPMSHQFGWSSSTAGLVQSSFFWGYAVSQLPGGWLAKQFTGKRILELGVLVWSLATALFPASAGFIPGLIISRIVVGIGEGVSPPSATDLIARSFPLTERARAVSFVFGGLSIGSILGLLLSPFCIEMIGWESVFYLFGFLGLIWYVGFQFAIEGTDPVSEKQFLCNKENDATLISTSTKGEQDSLVLNSEQLEALSSSNTHESPKDIKLATADSAIPWKSFFGSGTVWAMIYVHFCGNWGHYTFLSWLPTYFSEELHLDLTNAALVSLFPPLGSIIVSSIAAPFADMLISEGFDTTTVRKLCQAIAFVSPATCMAIACLDVNLTPWTIAALLTIGLALSSFALSGLYCTHQDISEEYASILLGLTSSAGALPGIIGVAFTGYILDQTHSWNMALFAPAIFFYLTGTVVWLGFASSKPQNFL